MSSTLKNILDPQPNTNTDSGLENNETPVFFHAYIFSKKKSTCTTSCQVPENGKNGPSNITYSVNCKLPKLGKHN